MVKKTLSIPEYQEDFLQETGISPSAKLQEKLDEIIENMTEEEMEALKKHSGGD